MNEKEILNVYLDHVNADTGDDCSAWARDYTDWAKALGLFVSDGNGNYRWHAPVTREELCTVLYRFFRITENGKDAVKEQL